MNEMHFNIIVHVLPNKSRNSNCEEIKPKKTNKQTNKKKVKINGMIPENIHANPTESH